jgi:cytosine/adenosine deaminase-related metal-dependent hydrolase
MTLLLKNAEALVTVDAARREIGLRFHALRGSVRLGETVEDVTRPHDAFGMTAIESAQQVAWIGDDVWFAHCVHLDDSEIELFARSGAGICQLTTIGLPVTRERHNAPSCALLNGAA